MGFSAQEQAAADGSEGPHHNCPEEAPDVQGRSPNLLVRIMPTGLDDAVEGEVEKVYGVSWEGFTLAWFGFWLQKGIPFLPKVKLKTSRSSLKPLYSAHA